MTQKTKTKIDDSIIKYLSDNGYKALESVFKRMILYRKAQSITLGEIAIHYGTDKGNLSKIEKKFAPTIPNMSRYINAFLKVTNLELGSFVE